MTLATSKGCDKRIPAKPKEHVRREESFPIVLGTKTALRRMFLTKVGAKPRVKMRVVPTSEKI
jgi:hypothetical protein